MDCLKISAQKLPHLARENSLSLAHASALSAVNVNGAQRMQLIEEVGVFCKDIILLHADQPIELPPSLFTELQARQYEGDLGKGKAGKVKAAILRPRPLVQPSL